MDNECGNAHQGREESNTEKFDIDDQSQTVRNHHGGDRKSWKGRLDFVMTLIAYNIGIEGFWLFPYLFYKNGGTAFLIPYFIVLIAVGIPMLFLEVSLGQFTSFSGLKSWNFYPLVNCLGIATTFLIFYLNLCSTVPVTWVGYYLYSSITFGDFPWTVCESQPGLLCSPAGNDTRQRGTYGNLFWRNRVLGITSSLAEIGSLQIHLAISLLVVWVFVYASILKGFQWTGKIAYVTAIFPYLLLIILFFVGVSVDGAWSGITYLLIPDFGMLWHPQIWIDATSQIFFSLSLGTGALQTLGSYNKFKQDSLTDCIIYEIIHVCTKIFGAVSIFGVMGFMAKQLNVDIAQVVAAGPWLAFIALPEALLMLPFGGKIMISLFFLMLFLLGIGSRFVGVQIFVSQFMDTFPIKFNFKNPRIIISTVTCAVSFMLCLIFVTQGGMYYLIYATVYPELCIVVPFFCFIECISIVYLYGGRRYMNDLKHMLGFNVPAYFPFCWCITAPIICCLLPLGYWIRKYPIQFESYVYPKWLQAVGSNLTAGSCLFIPVGILVLIFVHRRNTRVLTRAVLKNEQVHANTFRPFTNAATTESN